MVDVVLASEVLTVIGGPSTITLDVNFGPAGTRGALTYYGDGAPVNGSTAPSTTNLFDCYINKNPADAYYMYLYQYIYQSGSPVWVRFYKTIPSSYATTRNVTFTAGVGTLTIPITKDTLGFVSTSLLNTLNLNVQLSIESTKPTAIAFSKAFGGDNSSLVLTIYASEATSNAWTSLASTKVLHALISVVAATT